MWKSVLISKADCLIIQACSSPTCSSSPLLFRTCSSKFLFFFLFLLILFSSSSMSFFFSLLCYVSSPHASTVFRLPSPPPYISSFLPFSIYRQKVLWKMCDCSFHFCFLRFFISHVKLREMYTSPWIVCNGTKSWITQFESDSCHNLKWRMSQPTMVLLSFLFTGHGGFKYEEVVIEGPPCSKGHFIL